MRAAAFVAYMAHEARGARGRLAFFVACLAVGVAAVVAVAGLGSALESAIRREARQLLAADLSVSGRRPIPAAVAGIVAARPGVETARVKEMVTVLANPGDGARPGASLLVELKAVEGAYPFYGDLVLSPARPLAELLGADTVVVAPDLLSRLSTGVGGELLIGGERFRIAGAVESEPDRIAGVFTLGPRVFLSAAGLARSGLERFGSRVSHQFLVKVPAGWTAPDLARLADELRSAAGERHRVETFAEAQPALRDGLRRVERFLGLVALLSLLLGGVGVAQTTRAWLAGRMDAIAVLRTLGLRPREVLFLYLGQAVALALAGSAVGVVAGLALERALPPLLGDVLPAGLELPLWQPRAAARGIALGLGTALLFSLPPLLATRRVPPLRVLRKDVEPIAAGWTIRTATALALAAGVWAAASLQAGSALLGLQFALAVAVAAAVLGLVALLVVRGIGRLPRRWGRTWMRNGLAALARPGAATLGAVTALGLGVLLLVGIRLVERTLVAELSPGPESAAPTAFLLDIQPDQWPGVRDLLAAEGAREIESVPVVTARLASLAGRAVDELAGETEAERRRNWALTREQRLTWLDELPPDNRVVAGALWSDPERDEVSVERDFAADLGVGLGDDLTFDVQGVPVTLRITSLRSVDWRTFGINFFLVAEPAALAQAPHVRLATFRATAGEEQRIQDRLAAGYPNVTLLPIRRVLEVVRTVLGRLAVAVRFLGGFTILAGAVTLAGAVSAGSVRRAREIALLKTLGMTRRGVASMLAVEYALLGLVAGGVGAGGGLVLARVVVVRGMELTFRPDPLALALAVAAAVALTAATGVAASAAALNRRPAAVLGSES